MDDPIGHSAQAVELTLVRITLRARPALELSEIATYPGRGHQRGEPPCLYTSEDWETAQAEFRHHHPYLIGTAIRCTTLVGRLVVTEFLDDDAAAKADTTLEELRSDNWSASQRLCANEFASGVEAVRLLSARCDGVNVFVQRDAARALSEAAVDYRSL